MKFHDTPTVGLASDEARSSSAFGKNSSAHPHLALNPSHHGYSGMGMSSPCPSWGPEPSVQSHLPSPTCSSDPCLTTKQLPLHSRHHTSAPLIRSPFESTGFLSWTPRLPPSRAPSTEFLLQQPRELRKLISVEELNDLNTAPGRQCFPQLG